MNPLPENAVLVHLGNITFFVVAAVAVVGILVAFLFIAANVRFREYKLLKMTSPNLNLVMLSGAVVSCVTVILMGSSAWLSTKPSPEAMDVVCMLKHTGLWLGSVSFTLFFVPIAAKTWRVHRIFSDAAVKGRVIKDDRLLCFVAMFVVFDVGFLALWYGIDAPKCGTMQSSLMPGFMSYSIFPVDAEEKTSESSTNAIEFQLFCVSKLTPMWTAILCVYKGIVLYYIVYVAWAIRYVTFPSMRDAGGLIIGIFATLSSFCIGAPLVATMDRWPNVQYIIFSLTVFVPLFTVMMLHFIPKLILIRRHNRDEILTRSFSQYATPKQPEYSADEVIDLAIQNASLRKEATEKQRRYKAVLEQLRLTKAKLFKLTVMATGSGDTFQSDDNLRSGYTESTGDLSISDFKSKPNENLAQRVTRALIMKSQETSKSSDVSVDSTSQQVDEDTNNFESTQESTNSTNSQSNDTTGTCTSKQTDTDDESESSDQRKYPQKCTRHVSFGRTPSLQQTQLDIGQLEAARRQHQQQQQQQQQLQNNKSTGPIFLKPMVPVMGRKSWDYYTRGTGYLRYKSAVLRQGNYGDLTVITRSPASQQANPQSCQIETRPYKSATNGKIPTTIEMNLTRDKSKTTNGDLRYFSTSASSRPPSTSTDNNSSNDGIVSKKAAPPNDDQSTNDKFKLSQEGQGHNNNIDSPSVTSAFSVVSTAGRRPTSSTVDSAICTKIRYPRIDDIGITYEDDYSSGSDSDEYNTASSMDSITCELFPPLTPRHRHYLRRYDEMQARYLASKQKSQSHHKKSHIASEKSEGYCSGNEALYEKSAKSQASRKNSNNLPALQSYSSKDSKRKLPSYTSRKLDHTYLYESTTSSDSDSDWENSAALKQCWQRAAQASQRPILKRGPPAYSRTRKQGIFV